MTERAPWAAWYGLQRWRKRHRAQLQRQPLCVFCLKRAVVTPATVADHIKPHRGDWNSFCLGELQSLCQRCHDSTKKQLEHRGYVTDIGPDGWPLDPRHPTYR